MKFSAVAFVLFFVLATLSAVGLVVQPALAAVNSSGMILASGQNAATDQLILDSKFTTLKSTADKTLEFTVDINYSGTTAREFQLAATAPVGFNVSVGPAYQTAEIGSVYIDPIKSSTESVKVKVSPTFASFPEKLPSPGEYTVTLSASSGDLKSSIDLKAVITDKYSLTVTTAGDIVGRLNMEATAGSENTVTVVLTNDGTAVLNKVTLSSDKPSSWTVTYKPDEVTALEPGAKKEVQVIVKPAANAIAGDYMVTFTATTSDSAASSNVNVRVIVLTPTLWGWVGIGVVLLVVGALALIFMKLGRR